jgi:hypothetical protein
MAGYSCLKTRYGTRIVSSLELKDILEHPERYDMPCLMPQGFEVSETVSRSEPYRWRGFDLYVRQSPGQTIFNQEIVFEADGKRFLVTGDNISGLCLREKRDFIYSFIPKNRTPWTEYRNMPDRILELKPDYLLTGHGGAIPFDEKASRWKVWMEEWDESFRAILAQPNPSMGLDPRWVEIYPYRVRVAPGESRRFQIRITNHEDRTSTCSIRFRLPGGSRVEPGQMQLDIRPGEVVSRQVEVSFPSQFESHSLTLLADITWNGRHLGEIAEAIGYW